VIHKSGNAKRTGNPYSFYTASVVDDDGNVFGLNVADELVKEAEEEEMNLESIRNEERTIDVEFKPKGFDCAGTVVAW